MTSAKIMLNKLFYSDDFYVFSEFEELAYPTWDKIIHK